MKCKLNLKNHPKIFKVIFLRITIDFYYILAYNNKCYITNVI